MPQKAAQCNSQRKQNEMFLKQKHQTFATYYLHKETDVCAVFAHAICGQVIASIQSSFTWYKTRRGVQFG